MADAAEQLYEHFREYVSVLLERRPSLLDDVDSWDMALLAKRAAEAALVPLIWNEAVGETCDTAHVTQLLGVTRQALYDRVKRGTLLGIPGQGTTLFPAWQFASQGYVRPGVTQVLQAFRGMEPPVQPVELASWATTPCLDLEGQTPAEWLIAGRSVDAVRAAARHSAALLAA